MRIIEYKKRGDDYFYKYVDIGSIERNINFLPLFDIKGHSYREWYEQINKEPLGVIITIINYYILELENETPSELTQKMKSNIEIFTNFNNKWFEKDSSLFKGLDLNFEEIEDEILELIKNEEGYEKEIIFKDGSTIRLTDNETNIRSLYILELEFEDFKKQVTSITELLK